MTATETEFKIALSQSIFKPGTYTFKVVNAGKFPHNLAFKGPGLTSKVSPTVQGGGSGEVTVTLQAGSYELWCAVDSHKDKGMDMKITVSRGRFPGVARQPLEWALTPPGAPSTVAPRLATVPA